MELSREYKKGTKRKTVLYNIDDSKVEAAKSLLIYCAVNGYMPYLGSPRRRDLLPQKEQLRKIALAQQKRERKALKKIKEGYIPL